MALSDYDRQLLERCLARDSRAWEEFVDRFAGLLCQVVEHCAGVRHLSLDAAQKEDLCAEVLVTLIRDDMAVLRRFQKRASLATYLTVISRRVILRQMTRSRYLPKTNSELENDLQQILSTSTDDSDQVAYLLDQLNELEASLVKGFYLNSMSYEQLAAELGVPENSIGPTLHRARSKMLRALENQTLDEDAPKGSAKTDSQPKSPSAASRSKAARRQQK